MGSLLEKHKAKSPKARAPRNRTLTLTPEEYTLYAKRLLSLQSRVTVNEILDKTICQDVTEAVDYLPEQFVDLLFIDPPYNLNKS